MKKILKDYKFLSLAVLLFLCFIPFLVFGEGTNESGYRSLAYQTTPSMRPYGVFKGLRVCNTTGTDYFIPTASNADCYLL